MFNFGAFASVIDTLLRSAGFRGRTDTPTTLSSGEARIWYDNTTAKPKIRYGGTTYDLAGTTVGTTAVELQATTPGTAQTGHFSVDGTGKAGILESPKHYGPTGTAPSFAAISPDAIATTQAGPAVFVTAADAVAGSSVDGAAAGGKIEYTTGTAARRNSGDANGGDHVFLLGAGIGTGRAGMVLLGGTTAAFPGIQRSSTTVKFRLADDSADAPITTAAITASGQVTIPAGSAAAPSLKITGITSGLMQGAGNDVGIVNNGSLEVAFRADGTSIRLNRFYGFCSGAPDAVAADTGLERITGGVLGPDTGTYGAYGDFAAPLSNLTAGTMTMAAANKALIRGSFTKVTWTNAMITALGASLTGDITVCTLPAKTVVLNAYLIVGTAATGTTTLTMSIGRTGAGYIDYIIASDIKAAANTVYGDTIAERGTLIGGTAATRNSDLASYTATTDVKAHLISTVENLDQCVGSTGTIILETATLP